jgi:hypothetical protein
MCDITPKKDDGKGKPLAKKVDNAGASGAITIRASSCSGVPVHYP